MPARFECLIIFQANPEAGLLCGCNITCLKIQPAYILDSARSRDPDASCENWTGRETEKVKETKEKIKQSWACSSTRMCITAREKRIKGRRERAWRADTLTGCEQTMYSACFILSRFINVNIFHPDHSFHPFFLSSPAFPAMRNRREINWLSQPEMFLLSFPTWQFFTFH